MPDPVLPGPEGIVVTVERTAICGSDLHLYHDAPDREPASAWATRPSARWPRSGPHVRSVRPGDRVLVSGVVGCGVCRPCLAGQPNLCEAGQATAFGTVPDLPGGQAEAMAVPFADLFALPIPEGVADEAAVLLTDILPTGYLGALRASIAPGSTVVVVGLGPVGVMAVQCAALFGPARILAVDMVPERLARAEQLGAEPIDARTAPGYAAGDGGDGGRGAESVIEAVGADATVVDAVNCAAHGRHGLGGRGEPDHGPALPHGPRLLEEPDAARRLRPHPGTWPRPRPAGAGRSLHPGRDVHPPHGPEPGARGLRVVRLAGRRRLEGLAWTRRSETPRARRACG